MSSVVQNIIQNSKNSTNDNISMDTINDFPIPLPPIEEQKQIVEIIEKLLPLVDRYELAWNKITELNENFPYDLEKSILDYAFKGKLSVQDDNDLSAEQTIKNIASNSVSAVLKRLYSPSSSLITPRGGNVSPVSGSS